MEKFKKLVSLCTNSVEINVNNHKDYHQTTKECIEEDEISNYCSSEVIDKMIELDTIVSVIAYPRSGIGSYRVYHYDIDMAMDEMLELMK